VIVDIATYDSAADDRRRTENLRSVKTLDKLTESLVSAGYKISRSGVYLRLLPRRADMQEGKHSASQISSRTDRHAQDAH